MKRSIATTFLLVIALVAAACGGASEAEPGDTTGPDDPTTTTTAVDPIETTTTTTSPQELPDVRLLLRFNSTGGFVPVEYALTELTDFTLYSDGRVIIGPNPEGFPLPAVQRYLETSIDEQTLVEFIGLIEQLGIENFDNEANLEMQAIVADAETTIVDYFDADGGKHTYSVYALGMSEFEDADGRVAVMRDLDSLVRSIGTDGAATLPVDRLQVWIGEVQPDPSFHTVEPWAFAFPTNQADSEGFQFTCIELTGEDAAAAVEQLAKSNTTTLWEEGGVAYSVVSKPLLAGETGCQDIDY